MASTSTYTKTVLIASSATESESINCDDDTLIGFFTPATIDAGTMIIQASDDGTNWFSISMDTVTLAANTYFPIDPVLTLGARYVRLKQSGAAAAQRSFKCRVRYV